jgi:glycine hydroxymethyltransferase
VNASSRFFADSLQNRDPVIASEIALELRRQQTQIELGASENLVSSAVTEAQSYPSPCDDAEGEDVDRIEALAVDRVRALFDAEFANVQPNSSAQANGAVMLALLEPGDTVMSMTPGTQPAPSGKWFDAVRYGVNRDTLRIDYDEVRALAEEHRPKLMIAGQTAYARALDFAAFREIADSVGAMLMVDMAQIAGIVAAGRHQNPVPFAHVVTASTHNTLRGPHGGFIVTNDVGIARKIDSAVVRGGTLMHVIAGKAVAFGEALRPEFTRYIDRVLHHAQTLGKVLQAGGLDLVTRGTDNHLLLVDLRGKRLTGAQAQRALERAGIACNRNGMPFDTEGIRLGTQAATSRGFNAAQFEQVGAMILDVLSALEQDPAGDAHIERDVRECVRDLCSQFPIFAHTEALV